MPGPLSRLIMRNWRHRLIRSAPSVPSPSDEPTIRPDGDDPDLVLIVGNGTAHGFGVVTHQLALPGQLSREMSRLTGRPCAVHYIGDERMDISAGREWIGDQDLTVFDAVVVVFGVNDAIQLTPEHEWESGVRNLIRLLRARTKFCAQFLVLGIQPIRSIITLDSPLGSFAQKHANRLNRITHTIAAATDDTVFHPLAAAEFEDGHPFGSAALYRARAVEIAAALRPVVDSVRHMEGEARIPRQLP